MNLRQRMPPSLTRLETALSALMQGVVPVVPTELPLATALGRIVAALPAFSAIPPYHVASVDGWAIHTRDIVGASSYLPVTLASAPLWLDAGDRVPDDCNCVLGPDLIDHIGTIVQVLDDAIPWQGVLRGGGYISEGVHALVEGSKLRALDLLVARAAGFERMPVRCPRVQIIDLTARGCTGISTQFILECCISSGVDATAAQTCGRDALAVAKLLDAAPCDLIVTIGGTGIGRTDAAVAAVAMCGIVGAHGIALQPGRTAAIGKIKDTPLIALPGAPDQALAIWLAVVLPMLRRLCGQPLPPATRLPLSRKIASTVGMAEIVLLKNVSNNWMPLATGNLSLDAVAQADAWRLVSDESEGFAARAPLDAYMLRDCL